MTDIRLNYELDAKDGLLASVLLTHRCIQYFVLQPKKIDQFRKEFPLLTQSRTIINHKDIEDHVWYCEEQDTYYIIESNLNRLFVCSFDKYKLSEAVHWFITNFGVKDPYDKKVTYYQVEQYGCDPTDIFIDVRKKIYTEFYPSIDIEELFHSFVQSESKMLILTGAPGTGKSTFIKYALAHDIFNRVAYAKDKKVFGSSDFWEYLISDKHDLLILDDLDVDLGERNDFVSNMLSHIDGVFSSSLKVIITTNQPIKKIDEALLRPGRCFDIIDLRPLTRIEAAEIWTNILKVEAEFSSLFPDEVDEVTQATLMDAYQKHQAGKQKKSYLKDTGNMNPVRGFGFSTGRK